MGSTGVRSGLVLMSCKGIKKFNLLFFKKKDITHFIESEAGYNIDDNLLFETESI